MKLSHREAAANLAAIVKHAKIGVPIRGDDKMFLHEYLKEPEATEFCVGMHEGKRSLFVRRAGKWWQSHSLDTHQIID